MGKRKRVETLNLEPWIITMNMKWFLSCQHRRFRRYWEFIYHLQTATSNKLKNWKRKQNPFQKRMYRASTETWGLVTSHNNDKAIEYPLPALTLSEEECQLIMWIILKEYLPKSGINQYIKWDVLYGKKELQGLGLKNLFLTQGLSHVNDIVNHMCKHNITGHLITSNWEQLCLEIGLNVGVLSSNYEDYKGLLVIESWIQHTWRFPTQQGLSCNDGTAEIPLACKKDKVIMEWFMEKGYSRLELKCLNTIRIYLNAFTLADIVTGDGESITSSAWEVRYTDTDCCCNNCRWLL